jgi:hypothetical protein
MQLWILILHWLQNGGCLYRSRRLGGSLPLHPCAHATTSCQKQPGWWPSMRIQGFVDGMFGMIYEGMSGCGVNTGNSHSR